MTVVCMSWLVVHTEARASEPLLWRSTEAPWRDAGDRQGLARSGTAGCERTQQRAVAAFAHCL